MIDKEYEAILETLINKVEGNDCRTWEELTSDLRLDIHPDSLRKAFNVSKVSGYNIAKYYQNKLKEEFSIEEQQEFLENLQEDIFKERVKLQDTNREYRSYLREESRYENLLETLSYSLNKVPKLTYKKLGEELMIKPKKDVYGILCLSDWHCGKIIDNQFNFYDIDTMIDRAKCIQNKVIYYCQLHKVNQLIIEINGDMVDGMIHVSSRVAQEETTLEQIVTVSNVLANMINELKPYFNGIKVYCTIGNHGRLTSSKKDCITKENFEIIIPEFLKRQLIDVPIITSNNMDFLKYEIGNKTICVAHGHNDNINSVVTSFSSIYKVVPDEIHLGHTHGYKDINNCDIIVNVNGSLCGTDDYALSIRKTTKPSQNLIILNNDRCVYALEANI